jgi:pimeloyl-ACP methyl ester carboxylesterase
MALHQEHIRLGAAGLPGELMLPVNASSVVIFAHGSGSGRLSPRNTMVARHLHGLGFGTMLFDLLTDLEAADRSNVFDIRLLADRMMAALDWCGEHETTRELPIGLYGASTGAAAALSVAAARPQAVFAVVSRGGRPDLAIDLQAVRAPTLLVVGGDDLPTLRLNRTALDELRCEKELVIVGGATHLFEEPGALEAVAEKTGGWFVRHLAAIRVA